LASAEAYTPTAQRLIDGARERLGTIGEVANALADNLPQAKAPSGKSRRRRRRKKRQAEAAKAAKTADMTEIADGAKTPAKQNGRRPQRRRTPAKKPDTAEPKADQAPAETAS
jgi:hypothetical protein